MKKTRLEEIDLARGIGIFLVVLGHAIRQTGVSTPVLDIADSVIYSFHMPLFFILSGIVSVGLLYKTGEERKNYCKQKAVRFLIPYLFMSVLYIPVKLVLSGYAVKPFALTDIWKILIGVSPDVEMWFLYFLFWISALTALLVTRKNFLPVGVVSLVAGLCVYAGGWDLRLFQYGFFFLFGIGLRLHYDKFRTEISGWWVRIFLLIVFIGGNVLLFLRPEFTITGFFTGLSGSLLVLSWTMYLVTIKRNGKTEILSNGLRIAGKKSMDIYILSDPLNTVMKILFWSLLKWDYLVCTGICLVVGLTVPIPICDGIIRKIPVLRLLVLGEKNTSNSL